MELHDPAAASMYLRSVVKVRSYSFTSPKLNRVRPRLHAWFTASHPRPVLTGTSVFSTG
jgi:hypothetical protein